MLRGLGAARVDHDHVEPPLHLGAEGDERVRARQLDPFDQERLQRVGADEEHDVGLLDPVVPALPVAVECAGHGLGGLIDGDGRVERRRADAVQPAEAERERHVRPRLRAVVERDGPRPVLGDDVLQSSPRPRPSPVSLGTAANEPSGARRSVARRRFGSWCCCGQLPALLAGEALGDRMVAVAPHRERRGCRPRRPRSRSTHGRTGRSSCASRSRPRVTPRLALDMLCNHGARGAGAARDRGMCEWRRICRVRACWSSVPRPGSVGASPSRRSVRGHRWRSRPAAATSWRARSPKPAGASSWWATSGRPTTAPGSSTRPSPRSEGSTSWCSRPACRR